MPDGTDRFTSPKMQRFYDYWASKRQDGRLPARKDIDPIDIPDLLPGITIMDVVRENGTIRFRVRLAGTQHVESNRRDFTGQFIDEVFDGEDIDAILAGYRQVAERGEPYFRRSYIPLSGREHYRYQRLLLPLASDGETVDALIGFYEFGDVESSDGGSPPESFDSTLGGPVRRVGPAYPRVRKSN